MERNVVAAGDGRDRLLVGDGERAAHRVGVRVLEDDQAGHRLVGILGIAEGRRDGGRLDRPVGALGQRAHRRPYDDGMAGRLVHDEVAGGRRDHLLAAGEVGQLGDQVAHRARCHEEPGLHAEQLGGAILEGVDRGVVAEDVIAHLGGGHGAAHRRRRVGHSVGAQVDPGHPGQDSAGTPGGPPRRPASRSDDRPFGASPAASC